MKLCLGTVIKLICICKKKGVNNVRIGTKLFPDYNAYSKNETIIDDSLIGKWKACTNELNQEYRNFILDTDLEINKVYFENIAKEVFDTLIDGDKQLVFLASLIKVIELDGDIFDTSIIGFDSNNVKRRIIQEKNVDKIGLLSNILYYIHVTQNNKKGKDYINKVNDGFVASLEDYASDLTISAFNQTISSSIKKRVIDKEHPFTYYSNSTSFEGRKEEFQKLEIFANAEKPCVRWCSISGPAGSGKSRLAYEFKYSLEKRGWDTFEFTRDTGVSFETLNSIITVGQKNVLVLIDVETANLEALARWMSFQYSKRANVQICVILCQRLSKRITESEFSPWYTSIADYNEIVPSFEYVFPDGAEIYLSNLDNDSLSQISLSYVNSVYQNHKFSEQDVNIAIKKLHEVDPEHNRPLYLLFITDAIINNGLADINNEDSLLNYAFLRERSYIRNEIKAAFGCDYSQNKRLYDSIERSIAEAADNIFLKKKRLLSGADEIGLSQEQFSAITDTFGLTENGYIKIIEPDLLAEYFFIRYSHMFGGCLGDQDFWIALYRDFNYLITTKYRGFQRQFFSYSGINLGLYYIQGVYEAFCYSESMQERNRLIELINNFEKDYEEWIGNDPMIHPFGPQFAISSFFMMQGERYNKIKGIMNDSIEVKSDGFPKQSYDLYDSFIGNVANELFTELSEMVSSEMNALPFIEKFNEFSQLYEESRDRDSEVPLYYSRALYCAIVFFFARGMEYEDELASQVARIVPQRLNEIYEKYGVSEALVNYVLTLITLFCNDNHNFYKGKEELLEEIIVLNSMYGDEPDLKDIFIMFFEQLINNQIS